MYLCLVQEVPCAWLNGGLGLGTQLKLRGNKDQLCSAGVGGRWGWQSRCEADLQGGPSPGPRSPGSAGRGKETAGTTLCLCHCTFSKAEVPGRH